VWEQFLGAFAKLQKAIIFLSMSARLYEKTLIPMDGLQ
jgi:hypothetical protein